MSPLRAGFGSPQSCIIAHSMRSRFISLCRALPRVYESHFIGSVRPTNLIKPLSVSAAPAVKEQPKPTPASTRDNIRPGTLIGKKAPEILKLLTLKGQGKNKLRLSELHLLLRSCTTPEDKAALFDGLALFYKKNMVYTVETFTDTIKAAIRTGSIPEMADYIIDPEKRLVNYGGKRGFDLLLQELDKTGDDKRLLQVFNTMLKINFSIRPPTYGIIVKGLVSRGHIEVAKNVIEIGGESIPEEIRKLVDHGNVEQPKADNADAALEKP